MVAGESGSRAFATVREPSLDGLRAVAVLTVFGMHAMASAIPGGFVGVDVFFVLSGFLITSLLAQERKRHGRVCFAKFYMRRALRLYPALIGAVTLGVVTALLVGVPLAHYALASVVALSYTSDFVVWHEPGYFLNPFWSLAVEEQYYLLWPLALVGLLRTRHPLALTAALAVVAAVLKAAVFPLLGGDVLYFLPLGHLDELLIGSCLGLALTLHRAERLRRVLRRQAVGWCAALPLALVALRCGGITASWMYLGGLTFLGLCSGVLIGHLVSGSGGALRRLLSARFLVWLGVRSYAFYLVHQQFLDVLHFRFNLPLRYVVVIGLALSLAASAASYRWVEQPFLRRKQRFEAPPEQVRIPGQRAASDGAPVTHAPGLDEAAELKR